MDVGTGVVEPIGLAVQTLAISMAVINNFVIYFSATGDHGEVEMREVP